MLVAAPQLLDPNFNRAVVLMLEHSDEGALGIVLNRPTPVTVTEALPPDVLAAFVGDERVFEGGPVDPGSVIMLGDYMSEFAPARRNNSCVNQTSTRVGAAATVSPAAGVERS